MNVSIVYQEEEEKTKLFKRDRRGKMSGMAWLVVLIVVVIVLSGGIELSGFFESINVQSSNLVDVNKQIKFHVLDKYGGGPIASKTNKFALYASDGETIVENNLDTDANGHITTGSDYPSGEELYLRYEDSNDKKWWKFTVPQMNPKDAESATYNLIRLEGFTIGTYTTDQLKLANGTTFSDASTYDCSNMTTTPHFIYSLANTGSDNTGLMTSYDPVYEQNWNIELYITFSGTGYERIIVYDLDYDFTLGTTHYVGTQLDPYALTIHKVGNDYKSLGTQDVSFWLDCTGQQGGDSVTMQITAVAYGDHAYAQNHGGSFGPEVVTIAEQTVTVQP